MENVLLVCGNEKHSAAIAALLEETDYVLTRTVTDGAAARGLLETDAFHVVIIVSPLTDESGVELSVMTAGTTTSGVVLLVKRELVDKVSDRVASGGVLVLEKPLNVTMFRQALKFASAAHHRMTELKRDNSRLQDKIDEMKLVDRAKCVLIQYLKLTEPQAHRYIEKQAMDCRLSRKEVAEGILKAYET